MLIFCKNLGSSKYFSMPGQTHEKIFWIVLVVQYDDDLCQVESSTCYLEQSKSFTLTYICQKNDRVQLCQFKEGWEIKTPGWTAVRDWKIRTAALQFKKKLQY